MVTRQYQYISGDSHLESAPQDWIKRLPQEYQDLLPPERRHVANQGTYSGLTPDEFDPVRGSHSDKLAGVGSPHQRLTEMTQDGVDAEILFSLGVRMRRTEIANDEAYRTMVREFNNWLVEEYCAPDPARLIGLGQIPDTNVDDAIVALKQCKDLGIKGVQLRAFPNGGTRPSFDDDRFWAAAIEMEMPLTVHLGIDWGMPFVYAARTTTAPLFEYPKKPKKDLGSGDLGLRLVRYARAGAIDAIQLILFGTFDRLPKLQIYWAETQIGWIPNWLEQMDNNYRTNKRWSEEHLGVKLARYPISEYVREHCWWGFVNNPIGVKLRHEIGLNRIMWSTDFPHIESDWPESRAVADRMFSGIPDEERYQMTAGNAIRFFHLDR
jgi:predicted TIM-barrel fold metal-dependent hydrolase